MIRLARPADGPAVASLEAECLGIDAWTDALVMEAVADVLPTVSTLVAEVEGIVCAHAVLSVVEEVAELQRIGVTAAHRREGLASALLRSVVERARDGGAERLLLEVREQNDAARAFYTAHDFIEIGRRPHYYRDGATALVLQLDLPG